MKQGASLSGGKRSGTVPPVTESVVLSREAFVDAALGIIDSEGYEALTLKVLGQRLGVSHTAIYRYFDDIPSLLAAVRGQLLAGLVGDPLKAGDPRGRIIEFAFRFRDLVIQHPNFAQIFVHSFGDPNVLVPPSVVTVEEMERLGIKGSLLIQGYQALESYVVGGTVWDYSGAPLHHEIRRNRFRLVRHEEFDRVSRSETALAKNSEDAFRLGLECLLDGLIARSK